MALIPYRRPRAAIPSSDNRDTACCQWKASSYPAHYPAKQGVLVVDVLNPDHLGGTAATVSNFIISSADLDEIIYEFGDLVEMIEAAVEDDRPKPPL